MLLAIVSCARDHGVVWGAMALPTFHAMALYMQVLAPLATGYPIGLFAPRAPASPVVPNPRVTLEANRAIGCNAIVCVPAFVEVCH